MRKLAQTIRVRLVGEKVAGLVLLLLLTTYVLAKPVTASCIGPVGGQALSKEQELLRRSVLVRGLLSDTPAAQTAASQLGVFDRRARTAGLGLPKTSGSLSGVTCCRMMS